MYSLRDKVKHADILSVLVITFVIYISVHHMLTAVVGNFTHSYAPIKIVKDVCIFALLSVVLVVMGRRRLLLTLLRDDVNAIILLYMLIQVLLMLSVAGSDIKAAIAGVIFNVRFLAIFMIIRGIVLLGGQVDRLKYLLPKVLVVVGLIVALFGILQVTLLPLSFMEYLGYNGVTTISPYSTIDNNLNALRAFSTMRGPNELGSYLILPICISIGLFFSTKRLRFIIPAIIMLVALVLTSSRSAQLGFLGALIFMLTVKYWKKVSLKVKWLVGLFIIGLIAGILIAAMIIPSIRLAVFHSSTTDSSLLEGSSGDHYKLIIKGIAEVVAHPLGLGVGQAGPASFYKNDGQPNIAENYYIQIAQEVGIVGCLLFVALCIYVVKSLLLKGDNMAMALAASFIGLSINAMFLHVWVDEAVSYTWWITAAMFMPQLANFGIMERIRKKKDEFTDRT